VNNLSVRQKLSIPLIIACIAVALFVALSIYSSRALKAHSKAMSDNFVPAISTVLNADRDLYQARLALLESVLNPLDRVAQKQDYLDNSQQARERMLTFNTLMSDQSINYESATQFDHYFNLWNKENLALLESPNKSSYDKSNESFQALRTIYDKAGEAALAGAASLRDQSYRELARMGLLIESTAFISILYLGFISYFSPLAISRRILKVVSRVKEINTGNGDLTQRIDMESNDEIGSLCKSFNEMMGALAGMIRNIREEALSLRSQSLELNNVTDQVSHRATQQGIAVGSVAASFHESAAATQEVANIAVKTADRTQESLEAIKTSISNVKLTANNVQQLSGSFATTFSTADSLKQNSSEITSVVETIRSIAEQTNLLALNAAIEAARAGEQGRGFAVVADEVRTLASRTQASTNDIHQIVTRLHNQIENVFNAISTGSAQLEETVSLTNSTSQQLTTVNEVMDIIGDMTLQTATATEEQSQVSAEINRNISLIDQTSQDNVASIHQIQSISSQLRVLAEGLERNVNQFKI
jgi:methyl-accepting chemotaxis protein